jgi:hypothetical protein
MSESGDTPPSSSSSSSAVAVQQHEPIGKKEQIPNLIAVKESILLIITKKIDILSDELLALKKIPKADRDVELLAATEEVLADRKAERNRLIAEIADHKKDLRELQEGSSSSKGITNIFLYFVVFTTHILV